MNKLNVLAHISPEMRAVLKKQDEMAKDAFATDVGFEEMRKNYMKERRYWNEGGPEPQRVLESAIAGPDGSVPVRFYYPTDADVLPVIIYIHGGGWVVGNLDTHDRIMRMLSAEMGAVVMGIDYTLSPEAKFPQAIRECASAAVYLHEHAAEYGIDPEDVSIAGDSGGANMSLATYLYLRDEFHDAAYVKSLLLYYGAYGLTDSRSFRLLGGSWDGLGKADYEYYVKCYTSSLDDLESPYFNCLNADLTHNVPPCYIAAAEYDPLKDDSYTLADIFEEYGIPHELETFPGVLHAFLHNSRMLPAAADAIAHGAMFFTTRRSGV